MSANIQDDVVILFNDESHGWDITPTKPTIITEEDLISSIEFMVSRNIRAVIVRAASEPDQEKLNDYFENVMHTVPVILVSNTTDDLENMHQEAKRCADSFSQLRGVGWTTHNTLTFARVISAIDRSKGRIHRMDLKVQMGSLFQAIAVTRAT